MSAGLDLFILSGILHLRSLILFYYRFLYHLSLRLILRELLSAIPLTYWMMDSFTLSNGLSLLSACLLDWLYNITQAFICQCYFWIFPQIIHNIIFHIIFSDFNKLFLQFAQFSHSNCKPLYIIWLTNILSSFIITLLCLKGDSPIPWNISHQPTHPVPPIRRAQPAGYLPAG